MQSLPLLWQKQAAPALPLNTVPEGVDVTLGQVIDRDDGYCAAAVASLDTPSSACGSRASPSRNSPSDTWTASCVVGVLPDPEGTKRAPAQRRPWLQVGRSDLLKLFVCGSKVPSSPTRSMQTSKVKGRQSRMPCNMRGSVKGGMLRTRSRDGRGGDVAVVPADFASPTEQFGCHASLSPHTRPFRRSWSESASSRMHDLLVRRQRRHTAPQVNPQDSEVAAEVSVLAVLKEEYERKLMRMEDLRSNEVRHIGSRSFCSDVMAPCPTEVPSPERILAPCTPSSTLSSPGAGYSDMSQALAAEHGRHADKGELLGPHSVDDEERRARLERIAADAAVSMLLPALSPASRSVRSRSVSSDSLISGRRSRELTTRIATQRPDEQNIVQARQLLADMFASTRSSPSSQSNASRVMPYESAETKSQMSKGWCGVHSMDMGEPYWQSSASRARKHPPTLSHEPRVEGMVT
mmetsp:Transcript_13103/g.29802  ORF Transcript_13103/g.29802 Transcript_13103/m.29802 type:complete len:464 (-) Transcript_13103:41-1432(-)